MSKDIKNFIDELEGYGLRVRPSKKHYKVYLPEPDGRWVMDFASSPGDRHWLKSANRRLRARLQMLYGEPSDAEGGGYGNNGGKSQEQDKE